VVELGFANFWGRSKEISSALGDLRKRERLSFAALLVTDINTQNSLLMVNGDNELIERITYSQVDKDEIFELPGIVSRKKQLIPYLTSLLREIRA
jgi:manganese-dependent inorganic pyrophosphatase